MGGGQIRDLGIANWNPLEPATPAWRPPFAPFGEPASVSQTALEPPGNPPQWQSLDPFLPSHPHTPLANAIRKGILVAQDKNKGEGGGERVCIPGAQKQLETPQSDLEVVQPFESFNLLLRAYVPSRRHANAGFVCHERRAGGILLAIYFSVKASQAHSVPTSVEFLPRFPFQAVCHWGGCTK